MFNLKTFTGVQTSCARCLVLLAVALFVTGCSTAIAIADATGSAIVYAGKTVVNTLDAITPDIINRDDDD